MAFIDFPPMSLNGSLWNIHCILKNLNTHWFTVLEFCEYSWILCNILSFFLPLGGSVLSTILSPEGVFFDCSASQGCSSMWLQGWLTKRRHSLWKSGRAFILDVAVRNLKEVIQTIKIGGENLLLIALLMHFKDSHVEVPYIMLSRWWRSNIRTLVWFHRPGK